MIKERGKEGVERNGEEKWREREGSGEGERKRK
jgi:hypothetical protein